ncbi:MAG: hypothetical protein LBH82_04640, partial [Bacteroidales bacterium]|nr:hypothetical protein [Bacteroidales bacterium]
MFIREVKNRSGSISIQIIRKQNGRYKVVKTVGCAITCPQIESLKMEAKEQLKVLSGTDTSLFLSEKDDTVEQV